MRFDTLAPTVLRVLQDPFDLSVQCRLVERVKDVVRFGGLRLKRTEWH